MEWDKASDDLARKIGRHGTFLGFSKDGALFSVDKDNYLVGYNGYIGPTNGQTVEIPPMEASGSPKKAPSRPSTASTAMLAMIGENTAVHMAVLTPDGQTATACNPKKTFYSSQGAVRPVEGTLEQVTCKVCGWTIARMQKEALKEKKNDL